MNKRTSEFIGGVLAFVVVAAFIAAIFFLNLWWEKWRASVWAEEMHKAGVKTEVPK